MDVNRIGESIFCFLLAINVYLHFEFFLYLFISTEFSLDLVLSYSYSSFLVFCLSSSIFLIFCGYWRTGTAPSTA